MYNNLLSIEISDVMCSISINKNNKVFYKELFNNFYSTKNILILINNLILESDISYNEIDYILYSDYINNSNNLRLNISLIECLSLIWKIPIVKISSLLSICIEYFIKFKKKKILTIINLKSNFYYACFCLFSRNKIKSFYFREYSSVNEIEYKRLNYYIILINFNKKEFLYLQKKNNLLNCRENIYPKALYSIILLNNFIKKYNIIKNRKIKSFYLLEEDYMKYNY